MNTYPSPPGDEQLGRIDLLALLAPPFQLDGGPDFLLYQRAPGRAPVAGATLVLQNPTATPMPVRFVVSFKDVPGKDHFADVFTATLAPLEVGVLAVPISIRFHRPHTIQFFVMGSRTGTAESRVREATPGHLDQEATIKGILSGVAGLALIGIGRFTVTRVGGSVGWSYLTSWEIAGADPILSGSEASWTRIWAPADSPASAWVQEAAAPRTIETMTGCAGWGITFAALALLPIEYNFLSQSVGLLLGVALTGMFGLLSLFAGHRLLRIALPSLYPKDTIGSLVLRDGAGVSRVVGRT